MYPTLSAIPPRMVRGIGFSTASALALMLAACGGGGGGDGSTTTSDSGTMRIALTDAPHCGYDTVHVTVQKVRVHKSSSAADGDAGWSEVVLSPARRIDLLTLTNGVLEELGQTALPAGRYTQMRLVLAANDASNPRANAIKPTGGTETALDTPSGSQTGLKMNVDIDVAADKLADFVLDFDACKSVVKLGQSGRYNLKPVVSVLPRLADAGYRVVGYVSPALSPSTTSVSVQSAGVPIRSTPPDATGQFVLYPVPAGSYDLVVNAQGRVTATITGVPVVASAYTYVNASSAAIDPPASTLRTASGTVSIPGSPIDATVSVIKKYTGGPDVAVAAAPVDGSTGAFTYQLPSGAPVKTGYVASATSLSFAVDTASPTGKYTLSATAGSTTKSADVDLTSANSTTTFTFP